MLSSQSRISEKRQIFAAAKEWVSFKVASKRHRLFVQQHNIISCKLGRCNKTEGSSGVSGGKVDFLPPMDWRPPK